MLLSIQYQLFAEPPTSVSACTVNVLLATSISIVCALTVTISFELGVTVNSTTVEAAPLIFSILAIVKTFIAIAPLEYVIVPAVLSTYVLTEPTR